MHESVRRWRLRRTVGALRKRRVQPESRPGRGRGLPPETGVSRFLAMSPDAVPVIVAELALVLRSSPCGASTALAGQLGAPCQGHDATLWVMVDTDQNNCFRESSGGG
ncbi:MAG TPA: hypothetical protein VND64_04335 [Pirellulales bacterium]|nr:hypothetical protein [Pirellulales bacterium]